MPEHGESLLDARWQSRTGVEDATVEPGNQASPRPRAPSGIASRRRRDGRAKDATVLGLCLRASQSGTKSFSLVEGAVLARTAPYQPLHRCAGAQIVPAQCPGGLNFAVKPDSIAEIKLSPASRTSSVKLRTWFLADVWNASTFCA